DFHMTGVQTCALPISESHAIMSAAADLFRAGAPADGAEAMAVAERHRLSIDRWFYPCSPQMHAGLASMYEADPRFAESIDQYAQIGRASCREREGSAL